MSAAAAAAAATAVQAPLLRSQDNTFRQLQPKRAVHIRSRSSSGRRVVVTASKSPHSNADDSSQDDNLKFLLKLGAGSFAGAAVIKYGSILVPEITRPNITLALIMITTPVIVSVLILIKESTAEE